VEVMCSQFVKLLLSYSCFEYGLFRCAVSSSGYTCRGVKLDELWAPHFRNQVGQEPKSNTIKIFFPF
jgi:hypothetical protein